MIGYCPQHGYVDDETSGNCFCGRDLREVLEETRRVRLSKLMSGALRHFPHDLGIELDRNGWVELASLVDAVEERYGWAGREEVVAVVGTDPKGRFEIDDGGEEGDTRVRATYGHSVDVDVGDDALDPDEAPDALYHGTAPDKVDPILDE
ncbi:MAG: RNA 2'-phosphotransferase, partial [Halobacteria archaeon]|nr:RNA 2'-phosphotransferase [Halobacteria archaeon]